MVTINYVLMNKFRDLFETMYLFIYVIFMGVLFACMSANQKRELDPMGLQLQTVVTCHMGPENWTQDL